MALPYITHAQTVSYTQSLFWFVIVTNKICLWEARLLRYVIDIPTRILCTHTLYHDIYRNCILNEMFMH